MGFPEFKKIPGIRIGDLKRKSKLDIFIDLQCPYSKKGWDTIAPSVLGEWHKGIEVFIHPICLSNHRQSWSLTRTLFGLMKIDKTYAIEFINLIFKDHEQFYNGVWKEKGESEFLNFLLELIEENIGNLRERLETLIESNEVYFDSKKSIHYAAVKQVWSTPTFLVNDVPCFDLDSSSSLSDWNDKISTLDPD